VPVQVGRYDNGDWSPGPGATATDVPEATAVTPDTDADQAFGSGRAAEANQANQANQAARTGETQNGAPRLPDWLERELVEPPPAEAGGGTHPEATAAREGDPGTDEPGPEDTAETLTPLPAGGSAAEDVTGAGASGQWEAAPPLWESPSDSRQTEQAIEATAPEAVSAATVPSSADEADERDSVTAGTGTAAAGGATTGGNPREPRWDEARQAYIFWDDSRQEWLQFDYESQQWGPITRA
jgi:hypothetical protein